MNLLLRKLLLAEILATPVHTVGILTLVNNSGGAPPTCASKTMWQQSQLFYGKVILSTCKLDLRVYLLRIVTLMGLVVRGKENAKQTPKKIFQEY